MARLNSKVIILFSILSVLLGVSLSAALAQSKSTDTYRAFKLPKSKSHGIEWFD